MIRTLSDSFYFLLLLFFDCFVPHRIPHPHTPPSFDSSPCTDGTMLVSKPLCVFIYYCSKQVYKM